jgi:DNA-binding LacI/PurR family transcriptional regulator
VEKKIPIPYTTLKDIAKYLGLHHTTVSKALRNHPDIKETTCELVQKTARELDYHPSALARSFKNNQSATVGICVPLINLDFYANVICGAETVLDRAGFSILLCQAHESYEKEVKAVSALISNHVAGLLICPSQNTSDIKHLESFKRRSIPAVCFDRTIKRSGLDTVVVNDKKGAFDVVSHLIEIGRKRIAHLAGPAAVSIAKDRLQGYLDAHAHFGVSVREELIVQGAIDFDSGAVGMKRLLDTGPAPDAVFAVTDVVALGAYTEMKHRKILIPQTVALAGFGDVALSAYLSPPLTTVSQSPVEMGEIAAEIILAKIQERPQKRRPIKRVLPAELIVRASTRG